MNNVELSFSATENVLNSFKSRLFPMKNLDKYLTREPTPDTAAEPIPKVKTEPTPTKHKKSKLKLQQ